MATTKRRQPGERCDTLGASLPSDRISHYRIVSKLGAGGMGVVYLAEDTRLLRRVALKLLPPQLMVDEARVRRFELEARAASALNHPNIVTIYDIGQTDDGSFIAMELVVGRTLREVCGAPVACDTAVAWASQVAKALALAHASGIVHRDIKPDNLMVRDDGYVKVVDFGLAQLAPQPDEFGATMAPLTRPGTLLGTVHYMAPEQARGERIGGPADMFALGTVLYELVTGRHPVVATTLLEVLRSIEAAAPARPSDFVPSLPSGLESLLLSLLEKDPRNRPTAEEVLVVLARLERREPTPESPVKRLAPTSGMAVVGREAEREALHRALDAAEQGRGRLVAVAGEAGIGKTTLVETVLEEIRAGRRRCLIARGRCSERLAGTGAYLPWLEALDGLRRDDLSGAGRVEQIMRSIAPTWYAQVATLTADNPADAALMATLSAASQERTKRELGLLLEQLSQDRPLVLCFEDLHWADASTVDLLAFLGSRLASMRLLVVVTYRPSDLLLAKSPFLQIKQDLQSRGTCRELSLQFLSTDEVGRHLTLVFPGHAFADEFAMLIHTKTEGSPLFVADLVRYLSDRGVIVNDGGTRRVATALPSLDRDLPESVRGMIERKIGQLSDDDRRLLIVASVQGYQFDSAIVATAMRRDQAEVEERLETLERVFAFVRTEGEHVLPDGSIALRCRFIHILYQGALYGTLKATRRIETCKAVADAIVQRHGAEVERVSVDLASLYEAAREFMQASWFYLVAAQNASTVFANHEAIQLARRGLVAISSVLESDRGRRELDLQLTLGWALINTKGYAADEVEATYAGAVELCSRIGADAELYRPLWGLAMCYLNRARYERSRELASRILSLALRTNVPAALSTAHYMLGTVSVYLGGIRDARGHFEQGMRIGDSNSEAARLPDGRDAALSCRAQLTRVLWLLGYPDQALNVSNAAVAAADAAGQPHGMAFASFLDMLLRQCRAEYAEARRRAEALLAISREHDLPQYRAWAGIVLGWACARLGEPNGIDALRDSLDAYGRIGGELSRPHFSGLLADALRHHGRWDEARTAIAEAFASAERTGESYYNAALHCLDGQLLLESGTTAAEDGAAAAFEQAILAAQQQGAKSLELRATVGLAKARRYQSGNADALGRLSNIYGWFTEGLGTEDLRMARTLLTASPF